MDVLRWEKDHLLILDQSKLPFHTEYLPCFHYRQVAQAVQEMRIRGAPALGIAAAFGFVLAAYNFSENSRGNDLDKYLITAAQVLKATRPTAVNLSWAVDEMFEIYQGFKGQPLAVIREGLLATAWRIFTEEQEREEKISFFGVSLVPPKARILTYCNAGALATAGLGTALGIICRAFQGGKEIHVYVPETRPVLQGARLTVWELKQYGIPFTLITDNMVAYLFAQGKIDLVIVGADRIAANGDFANKIGTYNLAVLAAYHQRPFYVAAPIPTFDKNLATGENIPLEIRDPEEVRKIKGKLVTYPDCPVLNPAFDVTPCNLVSAFITDRGIIKPPFNIDFSSTGG